MMVECANFTGNTVQSECKDFTDDCLGAVDNAVKSWKPEHLKVPKTQSEGVEGMIALVEKCHAKCKDLASDSSDSIKQGCTRVDSSRMDHMGMDFAHCVKYSKQSFTAAMSLECVSYASKHEDAPKNPDDLTEALLDDMVKQFADHVRSKHSSADKEIEEVMEEYQTFILGWKWQEMPKTSDTWIAVGGAATSAALLAMIAVGMRRRNSQVVQLDEEMLMADE